MFCHSINNSDVCLVWDKPVDILRGKAMEFKSFFYCTPNFFNSMLHNLLSLHADIAHSAAHKAREIRRLDELDFRQLRFQHVQRVFPLGERN